MADDFVTRETCELKIENQNLVLKQISKDSANTREAVGKIARRLFEGNGEEAFDIQISRNTDHREAMQGRAEARLRHRWASRVGWAVAGAGWAILFLLSWLSGVFS